MQESLETVGQFVVARRKATKLFESVEESLNEVSRLVAMPVDRALYRSVAAGRNDGLSAGRLDSFDQVVTVVALVSDDRLGLKGVNQRPALRDIGDLSSGQDQAQRVAERINTRMNLGGQPASRAADRWIAAVFFSAPAACWWARTTVESMNNSSRSASPCRASATRAHTPLTSHRAKRTYTECHLPNSAGKSRHGLPTRAV